MTSTLHTSQAAASAAPGVRVSIGGTPANPHLLAAILKPSFTQYNRAQAQLAAAMKQTERVLSSVWNSEGLTHETAETIQAQLLHLGRIRKAALLLASTDKARHARRVAHSQKKHTQARQALRDGLALLAPYRTEKSLLGFLARYVQKEILSALRALQAGGTLREASPLPSRFPVTKPAHAPPLGRSRVSYALGLPGVAAA